MKSKTIHRTFIISAFLVATGHAVTTIPLTNASFEDRIGGNSAGTGTPSLVPGWQASTTTFGDVTDATSLFTSGLSGTNAIRINGGIQQLTSSVFVTGETYTLTVDIGRALGSTANGSGAQISFRNAADSANLASLFISATQINNIPIGTFQTFTFNYVAAGANSGLAVRPRLTDFNEATASRPYFDNVTLVTTIPEPGSAMLAGLGALALLRRRR